MSGTPPQRLLVSKHRLEALIDGIFAVAMTLLVIELKVPDRATVASIGMAQAVVDQFPTFLAWTISFLVLGIFWSAQQRIFHFVRTVDESLTWLTLVYLALVSLMPFSSALIGQQPTRLSSQIIYSAHAAALSVMALLITRYACRHPELWAVDPPPQFYRAVRIRCLGLTMVALLAVGITRVAPGFGSMAFMLMWPITRVSRRIESAAPADTP
jgi:uncharacterized membrane protein